MLNDTTCSCLMPLDVSELYIFGFSSSLGTKRRTMKQTVDSPEASADIQNQLRFSYIFFLNGASLLGHASQIILHIF